MRPTGETVYRLAITLKDFRSCHKLMTKKERLYRPTVVAEREGKIIGFLSTFYPENGEVEANALTASSPFVGMRLIEAYERYLWLAGISRYIFAVDKKNEKWLKIIEKMGIKCYAETEAEKWYVKYLNESITE